MNNQGRFYSNEEIKQMVMINGISEIEEYLSCSPRRVQEFIEDYVETIKQANAKTIQGENIDEE